MEFEAEDFDYLCYLGDLIHKPIDGPRPNHVGENVFAFQWEQLMVKPMEHGDSPPNVQLALILWKLTRRITQRHASVAASFITWLGTNCGNAIIQRSLRLYFDANIGREESFVAAWSIDNLPHNGSGIRLIDAVLATADCWGRDILDNGPRLQRLPELSVEDHQTVEQVAYWCGTEDGCKFIRLCEGQIRERERVTVDESIRIMTGVQKR
jgi:hypothetical protein